MLQRTLTAGAMGVGTPKLKFPTISKEMADSSWITDLLESSDTLGKRRTEKREARSTVAKYAIISDHMRSLKEKRDSLSLDAMLALVTGSCTGDGRNWERVTAEKAAVMKELQTAIQLEAPGYIDMEEVPKLRAVYANEMAAITDGMVSKEIDPKKGIPEMNDLRDKAAKVTAADAVLVHHIATGVPKRLDKLRSRPPSRKTRRSFRSKSPIGR